MLFCYEFCLAVSAHWTSFNVEVSFQGSGQEMEIIAELFLEQSATSFILLLFLISFFFSGSIFVATVGVSANRKQKVIFLLWCDWYFAFMEVSESVFAV